MINDYGLDLDRLLDMAGGSYLQTVRYGANNHLLCPVCGGFKSPAYHECRSCEMIANQARSLRETRAIGDTVRPLADRIACGVYAAEPGSQTLKMMYGYKETRPASPDYRRNVSALIALALIGHRRCLDELAGMPVSGWAMVPSTTSSPRFNRPHPLHDIINGLLPRIPEIRLSCHKPKTRNLDPDAFALVDPVDRSLLAGNVVLIDDSWVTGGTVQSAAARLKIEGAAQVSIYCVARIVSTDYLKSVDQNSAKLFHTNVRYISGYCPWHRLVETTEQ